MYCLSVLAALSAKMTKNGFVSYVERQCVTVCFRDSCPLAYSDIQNFR